MPRPHVAQRRVPAPAVVKHIDVVPDILLGLLAGAVVTVVDLLRLQRVEEAFADSVVPATALAAMKRSTDELRDRIAGSLYGLLVGDALGCPVEGWPPRRIKQRYGVLDTMEEPQRRWRPLGLHSDDGQQALALCDALLQNPDNAEVGFARLMVELLRTGRKGKGVFGLHRGTGRNFRSTVLALKENLDDPFAGAQASAGNGVAMMIAPAALYWRDDLDRLCAAVIRVARVKTVDLRSIAAAGAVAYLVAGALSCGTAPELDVDELRTFVRCVEREGAEAVGSSEHLGVFSGVMEHALDLRRAPRDVVLARIAQMANITADRTCYPTTGYAPASVVTSVHMALTSTSYEQAVRDTVNLGGDADTTGAMVGAICGALHGYGSIPLRWSEALLAAECFDDRVDGLLHRTGGFKPEVPLVSLEQEWTKIQLAGKQTRS